MKQKYFYITFLFFVVYNNVYAQKKYLEHQKNKYLHFLDSSKSSTKKAINDKVTTINEINKTANYHIGWEDGKVPDFQSPYTFSRHEVRLNLLGPSTYAFTDRFEMSSYLLLIICPNLSFKYRFLEKGSIAMAFEYGGAIGALPLAAGGGLMLPRGAIGVGTVGALTLTDGFLKLYLGWHATQKLTLSIRGGISSIHGHYYGLGGFAAMGDGAAAMIIPVNAGLMGANWYMGGFEADYVINKNNAFVLKSAIGQFYINKIMDQNASIYSSSYLMNPTFTWDHARKHRHFMLGLYGYFDPPNWKLLSNNKLPISPYVNFYWVFNNKKKPKE